MPEARCTLLTVQSVSVKRAQEWLLGPMAASVIHLIQEVMVSPQPRLFRGSCRGGAAKECVWFGASCCTSHAARSVLPRLLFFCMNSFGLELGLGSVSSQNEGSELYAVLSPLTVWPFTLSDLSRGELFADP